MVTEDWGSPTSAQTILDVVVRWVWHTDDFASLMVGRIQLAQISQGAASRDWYWTLYFCEPGERPSYSSEDQGSAIAVAEAHARKVLGG